MTQQLISTTPEQFHAVRAAGIGSSDIAAIMDVDPYRSAYRVWEEKTGRRPSDADSKFTRAGRILEGAVAQYFTEESASVIIPGTEGNVHYIHPVHAIARATPDRQYTRDVFRGVLECKTTQKQVTKEDMPMRWFIQNQWQAGVMNAQNPGLVDECAVAWLVRGLDFDCHLFEPDPEFFDYLLNMAGMFWEQFVVTDTPPDIHRATDVERKYMQHVPGKVVTAGDDLLAEYSTLIEIREQIAELSEKEEILKDRFKVIMKDAEAVEYFGETLVTWKASKPVTRLEGSRLKTEQPDIWKQYAREGAPVRTFLVKK